MTNWHLISVPNEWTECERYGNAIIATRGGWFKGFAVRYETLSGLSRQECRRFIDNAIAQKL